MFVTVAGLIPQKSAWKLLDAQPWDPLSVTLTETNHFLAPEN